MRELSGLSQRGAADLAGVYLTYYRQVESGDKTPSNRWIGVVMQALGTHLASPKARKNRRVA